MVESQKHNIVEKQLPERYVQYDNIYEKFVQYSVIFFWDFVCVCNVIFKAHTSQTKFLRVVGWQLKERKKMNWNSYILDFNLMTVLFF